MEPKDFLAHYGKLGMHWGKRSAATKARAETTIRSVRGKPKEVAKRGPEGLIRLKKTEKAKEEENISEDAAKKNALKKKKISEMSNAELQTVNTRLQLERTYKDLKKSDLSPGKKIVADIIGNAAKQTASTLASKAMMSGVEAILKAGVKAKK